LGIETLGSIFTKLIERNTTIPCKKSQIFSTAADNQPAVSVHVLQGEREMAQYNKTLGRFELVGIPPAPRGMPQIEVTFDIDANGIVHVSAKDLGTGKQQSIKIEASSGLSDSEIEKMVKEAQEHADEDKLAKEKQEVKNNAENLVYSTEKLLKEQADKIDSQSKASIESAIDNLKKAQETNDTETIKKAIEEVTQASHKLAELLYKDAGQQQAAGPEGPQDPSAGAQPQGSGPDDENVVDADFETVN
jgi:molecular chaperone DnaK